jgi:hypothetical protein
MPSTYTPIATTTLGSAQTTVTFSSISGTYTDLRFVIVAGQTVLNENMRWRYNSDSGGNYSWTQLLGNGTTASSSRSNTNITGLNLSGDLGGSAIESLIKIDIMNYSNTTTNKTSITRFDSLQKSRAQVNVGLYRSTSAITSVTFDFSNGTDTFVAGSIFTLYGIKAA